MPTTEIHTDTATQLRIVLAHLPDRFNSVAWSPNGGTLASGSEDRTVRLWDYKTATELKIYKLTHPTHFIIGVFFQPAMAVVDSLGKTKLGDPDIIIDTLGLDASAAIATATMIRQTSAKIVLVGESNVGKSCLALQLAQNRYEEQGTTHGMRLWSMPPEQLSPIMAAPSGEKREVVIWDLGGQEEYRLVHQLFLHDTTLALILFDPTRGEKAFEDAQEWNLRLEKQLRGQKTAKLLIGTKQDQWPEGMLDSTRIEWLTTDCNIVVFLPTSAKEGRGLDELRTAIAKELDWSSLSQTTRPRLFQKIRETLEEQRNRGEVVLLYTDLEKKIKTAAPDEYDPAAVETVVSQLQQQGVLVDARLTSGQRTLILQIGYVEIYAGSLILTVHNNPRGVPALEIADAISLKSFPGIKDAERLPVFQEHIVLECVIQLLLEHGIGLKHEGLLIFPALFPATAAEDKTDIKHTVSLYYDFTGAIDNIYSSLVVRLALSESFGRVRLWKDRAEYEQPGQGVCGLRKVDRRSGLAHLDLLFGNQTPPDKRGLFTLFVEEHLRKEGVTINEVLEMECKCGYRFDQSLVLEYIAENCSEIVCPRPKCQTLNRISMGARKTLTNNPTLKTELLALKTVVEWKTKADISEVKREMAEQKPSQENPIRILHLSDLHITADCDPATLLQPLIADLKDKAEGLGFEELDYLVVSGDLTNFAQAEEFEKAYQFISRLIKDFRLSAQRCVIVPGNHDLSWKAKAYDLAYDIPKGQKDGSYLQKDDIYLVRNENEYPKRFENFSKFYHELLQQKYPLKIESQCLVFPF